MNIYRTAVGKKRSIVLLAMVQNLTTWKKKQQLAHLQLAYLLTDIIMAFGIISGLQEIAMRNEVQNHKITMMTVQAWERVISLVTHNKEEKDIALSIIEILMKKDSMFTNVSHIPTYNGKCDIKHNLKRATRNKEWFEAAAIKLGACIQLVDKIRSHSHYKVRGELVESISIILENCPRILVDTILEIMSDAPQHRKELTLLLNSILVSIEDPSVSHLYKKIVNFYTMQKAWYLPIEVFEDIPLIQAQSNHAQMEKRPKRVTSKPSRYITTSSDEAPKKRKKGSIITAEDIEKDTHEIRNALEEDYSSSDSSNNNYPTPTPHTPTNNLSQHTYIHTDSQSHTNVQSYTNTQQLDTNVSPHTSVQSHINVQPHASIQSHTNSQLDTNISLHTSVPSYVNVQPHASIQSHISSQLNTNVSPHTSVQPYVNVQPHANIQSHTNTHLDTNVVPHTIIEPYINFQPYANIQSHTNTQLDTNVSPHTSIRSNISHTVPIVSRISSVTHTLPTYSFINNNTEEISSEQNISRILSHSNRREEISAPQSEKTDNWRTRVETELKRMNKLLENILKYMQDQSHKQVSHKPAILPISSVEEMEAFELINDDSYSDVVNYFRYIGGFNLKEAIKLCFKEGLKDTVTSSFTWWGREGRQRPMYNTRFVIAIYEAVCNNRYFEKPTRSEFQVQMREALRTAKERLRSKIRGPRKQFDDGIIGRNFWNDERNA